MSTYLPTVFGENLMDVFDDFDRNFFRDVHNVDRALYGKHAQHVMKTDVKETEDGYEVDVDLPGFKKDEIKLELNQGYLLQKTLSNSVHYSTYLQTICCAWTAEKHSFWTIFLQVTKSELKPYFKL